LSKNPDENKKAILSFNEFKKNHNRFLKDRYNRYLWTVKEWKRLIGRGVNRPPHFDTLYYEGSNAFFHGLYNASILTIAATIELTLKGIVNLSMMSSKMNKNFNNVIKEAVKQEIISPKLGDELHFLRRNIRNILTHEQDMAAHMTLGWKKDPESETGYMLDDVRLEKLASLQRDSKESFLVSREVFARETIQLLFKVFKSCITSGKDWSDLVKKKKK